ncbi:MAG: hypothetical protein ACOYKE_00595 [Ferruginibacter sp.]
MKKLLFAAAIISSAVFFASCNGGGGDPKTTLIAFFDALSKKDIEGARKLATAESKSMLDMMDMAMKMSKDTKETEKYDKTKMEFGEPKIEGDKATIAVKEKTSGESTNFTLKKEGGAWKVAFDKTSMMQMGMDKVNEKGGMDSITNAIKDINTDSIGKALEESSKALDSASKILKDMNK